MGDLFDDVSLLQPLKCFTNLSVVQIFQSSLMAGTGEQLVRTILERKHAKHYGSGSI